MFRCVSLSHSISLYDRVASNNNKHVFDMGHAMATFSLNAFNQVNHVIKDMMRLHGAKQKPFTFSQNIQQGWSYKYAHIIAAV